MTEYVINANNLTKTFADKTVVSSISLQVKKGEIFGFLGPNGAGKTTTIRMLCGLLTPDGGSGSCLGYDIVKQAETIKTLVGYMSQHFSLYGDLSIQENLDFIARLYQIKDRKIAIAQSLAQLGLTNRAKQLAETLSGGWKQRLALAAALIHQPKLLFLDEPTAGVDPAARRSFWEEIHTLAAGGVTILVSTHYMDEAERCNRLTYMVDGQLLVIGTPEEIITKTNLIVWSVKGPDLANLVILLKKDPAVLQASILGNSLHICGKDANALNTLVAFYSKQTNLNWQQIEPNLEEVFIDLVSQLRKKY